MRSDIECKEGGQRIIDLAASEITHKQQPQKEIEAKDGMAHTEVNMDNDQLKKFLSGLCLATLISGSVLMVSGCATKASA
jgi:radical SAM modification target selenobiotic family peptide